MDHQGIPLSLWGIFLWLLRELKDSCSEKSSERTELCWGCGGFAGSVAWNKPLKDIFELVL